MASTAIAIQMLQCRIEGSPICVVMKVYFIVYEGNVTLFLCYEGNVTLMLCYEGNVALALL